MNYNILDRTGHTEHQWDSSVTAEVDAARMLFNSLTSKGYRAFQGGKDGKRIDRFDPEIEELTFVPQLQGG